MPSSRSRSRTRTPARPPFALTLLTIVISIIFSSILWLIINCVCCLLAFVTKRRQKPPSEQSGEQMYFIKVTGFISPTILLLPLLLLLFSFRHKGTGTPWVFLFFIFVRTLIERPPGAFMSTFDYICQLPVFHIWSIYQSSSILIFRVWNMLWIYAFKSGKQYSYSIMQDLLLSVVKFSVPNQNISCIFLFILKILENFYLCWKQLLYKLFVRVL